MGGHHEVNDGDLPDDHLLKPYEAARALGITTGTLARWPAANGRQRGQAARRNRSRPV
jgi:hypothetical protein